jgi:hypothetical protein
MVMEKCKDLHLSEVKEAWVVHLGSRILNLLHPGSGIFSIPDPRSKKRRGKK